MGGRVPLGYPLAIPDAETGAPPGWAFSDQGKRGEDADGDGDAEIVFGPAPTTQGWLIMRIAIASTSVAASTCRVYKDAVADENLKDASENGNLDIADENSPIWIPPNSRLIVRWTGLTPNAVVAANIQYQTLGAA